MSKQKFIIVSNRLPVSVSKEGGKLVVTPSAGGLATAMSSLEGNTAERLWVGWPGISADDLTKRERDEITGHLRVLGFAPVFLTREQVKLFYDGYSNDTIWPLFHYFKATARHSSEYWPAYKEVNNLFADTVSQYADEQAAVWVHDYHLMLLPNMVRQQLPAASIGFFLHIPFPSFELFRLLPNRKEILEGLLGADLVGFHIYDYVRHFTSSVLRTLGHEIHNGSIHLENRIVKADAFPIGIDYQKFAGSVELASVKDEAKVLDRHYKKQKIILSVDRLDYSKGIPQRLEAFEKFLADNPAYHQKVTLVVIAVPSRTEVEAYKDLREQVERMVSRINGAYGSVAWTPISYQFKNLPFDQLAALYIKAEVAMVTPVRDGMNLVAKEYVACKQNTNGVLILSEFTGAVDELSEALVVNPNDSEAIVEALKAALEMPDDEQRRRIETMQSRIAAYTVQRWATDFIEQLAAARHMQMRRTSKLLSPHKRGRIIQGFKAAQKRAFILDYDGTLRPFVSSPKASRAAPSPTLMQLLQNLCTLPNTQVCIISGRTRDTLDKWFGSLPATLVAEHGFWVRQVGEWSQEETDFRSYKRQTLELMHNYAERTPGAHVEEKSFSIVWHYRNVSPELAFARNASLKHDLGLLLERSDVGIFSGHKIIEVKPRGITKGVVVNDLLFDQTYDFILCAGDDYTDEDMFKALPETAHSIKVGLGDTAARFQVESPKKLIALLEKLSQ